MSSIPFSPEYVQKVTREIARDSSEGSSEGSSRGSPEGSSDFSPEFLKIAKRDLRAALNSSFPLPALLEIVSESSVFSPVTNAEKLISATKSLFPSVKYDFSHTEKDEPPNPYHASVENTEVTGVAVKDIGYFPDRNYLPRENNVWFRDEVISCDPRFPQIWGGTAPVFSLDGTKVFSPEYAFIYDISRYLNTTNTALSNTYYTIAARVKEKGVHKHMLNIFTLLKISGYHHDPELDGVELPLVSSCKETWLNFAARHFGNLIDNPASTFRHCLNREHVRVTAGERLDQGVPGETPADTIRLAHCILSESFKLAIRSSIETTITQRRRYSQLRRVGWRDLKPTSLVLIEEDVSAFLEEKDDFESNLLYAELEFPNILPGNKLTDSFFTEIAKLSKEQILDLANYFLLNTFNLIDETFVAGPGEESIPLVYERKYTLLPTGAPCRPATPNFVDLNDLNDHVLATSIEFYRKFCDFPAVKDIPGVSRLEEFEDLFHNIVAESYDKDTAATVFTIYENLPKAEIKVGGSNLNPCNYVFTNEGYAEAITSFLK